MGGLCPLFFDGAVCDFNELPLPSDKNGIARVYEYLKYIRMKEGKASLFIHIAEKRNKMSRYLHRWKRLSIFAKFNNKK